MKLPPFMVRTVRVLGLSATGFSLLVILLLLGCQRKLIYFPRKYNTGAIREAERAGFITLRFQSTTGSQTAFVLPPREGDPQRPSRLWVLLGGNAGQALDWTDLALKYPDRRAAFLMIDYPGYGENEGKPSRESIIQSSLEALDVWKMQFPASPPVAGQTTTSPTAHSIPLGVMGHSLGAAAALELAVRTQPDRIVLVSPFTSLMDMARLSVGRGLSWLLLDRFDNAARLEEIATRSPRPAVTILHGTADEIVPFKMGERLAAAHMGWTRFVPLQNGDHNMVLDYFDDEIIAAMTNSTKE